MGKIKADLKSGIQFGNWEVLEDNGPGQHIKCRCRCGHEQYVAKHYLRDGTAKECKNCRLRRQCPSVGTKFGDQITISECWSQKCGKTTRRFCMVRCESCQRERKVRLEILRSGSSLRCKSCSTRITATKHGLTDSPIYRSWSSMLNRCNSIKNPWYHRYGGRGIKVCQYLTESVVNLLNTVGDRPPEKSLDRINNDGHYSCGDCEECRRNQWKMNLRWASQKEQIRNAGAYALLKKELTLFGETKTIAEWIQISENIK